MVKLVIAGVADCPYFARVELLADQLASNLPHFEIMKIVKMPSEWENFLVSLCEENLWSHHTSPVVWREPVDFGGMKLLIGGSNEFQEYACCYYGVKSEMTSCMMVNVASENLRIKKEQEAELEAERLSNKPFKIAITRANSAIAYSVLPSFVNGHIFGMDTEITIYLYDSSDYAQVLHGVAMELEDTASAQLRSIKVCAEPTEAFVDADFILMLDELRRNPNESGMHWNERKVQHYTDYGRLISETAKKTVQIALVVRANDDFNSTYAASSIFNATRDFISSRNIVAIPAEAYNSVKSIIGERLDVNPSQVQDTIIWGTRRQLELIHIDCSQAKIFDSRHSAVWAPMEFSLPVRDLVHDDSWLERDLWRLVQLRLKEEEDHTGHTAALSISGSILTVLRHWFKGDGGPRIFSLGVASEGWYNIPHEMFFFIPVRLNSPGLWTPVTELKISDRLKADIHRIITQGNDEYHRVEQSDESVHLLQEEESSVVLIIETKIPDAEARGNNKVKNHHRDYMGFPPSAENLRTSKASTESFQHRRIYQIETEGEPMVEVQFLDQESNSDRASQKDGSTLSMSEKDERDHLDEVKDLGEVNDRGEVSDLTEEHTQQGDD